MRENVYSPMQIISLILVIALASVGCHSVKPHSSATIVIEGSVEKPGAYELARPNKATTVNDIVQLAGGLDRSISEKSNVRAFFVNRGLKSDIVVFKQGQWNVPPKELGFDIFQFGRLSIRQSMD